MSWIKKKKKMKPFKVYTRDLIFAIVTKKCSTELVSTLSKLYNKFLAKSYFPGN